MDLRRMTTADLIRALQQVDPEGTAVVVVSDIYDNQTEKIAVVPLAPGESWVPPPEVRAVLLRTALTD